MRLKVIDENKVKILIENKDFDEYSVPEDVCDYEKSAVREFILKLLNEIYIQTGIDFFNSKVFLEIIPGTSDAFYIVISRISSENQPFQLTSVKADEDMYLFELYHPENIFDVSNLINKQNTLKVGNSKMYRYKNKYYIAVYFPPETVSDAKFYDLIKKITEYSKKCRWNILNEPILDEWGEMISDNIFQSIK